MDLCLGGQQAPPTAEWTADVAIGTFLGLMRVKLVEPHGPLAIKRALNKTATAGVGEVLLDGPLLHLSIALVGALHRPTWTFVLFWWASLEEVKS